MEKPASCKGCTAYFSPRFPKRYKAKSTKRFRVVLGIGGNVGDVRRRFDTLIAILQSSAVLDVMQSSFILKNPPFGYLAQEEFYNAILVVQTSLYPHAFLHRMLWIEKRLGRIRSFKDAPRTLDIDIIFFDEVVQKTQRLKLPHPHWHKRDSVLIPFKSLL